MKKAYSVIVVGAVCWRISVAGAQVHPEAEKLFRDGKALMKTGKTAEACAAFEASEKAEHNIATVLSLADCREKNQQYASAWAWFLQADSQTRSDTSKASLNSTAKARATALEPRMSYLTINVPGESRMADLVVSRDGIAIDRAEWNCAIPIDGGAHEISGKAPGHEPWSTQVTIAPERDNQSVEVPKFKELPQLVAPQPVASQPVASHSDLRAYQGALQISPPPPSPFTPRRKIAIGVAAGGLVFAGVGVGFGFNARSLREEALATCPPQSCGIDDAARANATNARARQRALVANIGYAAGGAAVISGAVLWFISPPAAEVRIAVSPQSAGEIKGLVVSGWF